MVPFATKSEPLLYCTALQSALSEVLCLPLRAFKPYQLLSKGQAELRTCGVLLGYVAYSVGRDKGHKRVGPVRGLSGDANICRRQSRRLSRVHLVMSSRHSYTPASNGGHARPWPDADDTRDTASSTRREDAEVTITSFTLATHPKDRFSTNMKWLRLDTTSSLSSIDAHSVTTTADPSIQLTPKHMRVPATESGPTGTWQVRLPKAR